MDLHTSTLSDHCGSRVQNKAWSDIKIDNNTYMILIIKQEDKWNVFLTDLVEIWMESLTKQTVLQKCQTLNPLLNIDALGYDKIVTNILDHIGTHIVECSVNEIKLRTTIEGGVFKFILNLTKGTREDFFENVTKPMCLTSIELLRQRTILLDLVKKKDEEILQYKSQEHIETEIFTEDQLNVKPSMTETLDCVNVFKSLMDFYSSIDVNEAHIKMESGIFNKSLDHDIGNSEVIQKVIRDGVKSSALTAQNSEIFSNDDECNDEVKPNSTEKISKSKVNYAPTAIHRPTKKPKKTYSDFIL